MSMVENVVSSVWDGTAVPATSNPMEFTDTLWTMDSKYGNIDLSLSTNPNCSGLFNDDMDLFSEMMDYGLTTEILPSTVLQCDVVEQNCDQLSSSSPDNWSIDPSPSSNAAISPESYIVSSTTDNPTDLVASSTVVEECNSTAPDVDLLSMLFSDQDVPLEDILEQMETAALKQTQCAEIVRLDHDYTKKKSVEVSGLPSTSSTDIDVEVESLCEDSVFAEPVPLSKKKKFAEVERRSRNNEASRRSRAIRKEKFKKMENDVQRLAADNQRMRVLLKDMESVARRCKEQLVSSLGKKG